jgi:hypothetical protein
LGTSKSWICIKKIQIKSELRYIGRCREADAASPSTAFHDSLVFRLRSKFPLSKIDAPKR